MFSSSQLHVSTTYIRHQAGAQEGKKLKTGIKAEKR
jgi:hypothetical protein